jgi:hypothetical protein
VWTWSTVVWTGSVAGYIVDQRAARTLGVAALHRHVAHER